MKFVSVMGDSISTMNGYNPPGYAVYYDEEKQRLNGITSVYDIWWAKVNQALEAYLCVNNSYSGSTVSSRFAPGPEWPAACSADRAENLHTLESEPDIVLIYIGFNDFGNQINVFKDEYDGFRNSNDTTTFAVAYDHMLWRIKNRYPNAAVVCSTLMRTRIRNRKDWTFPEKNGSVFFEDFNNAIRSVSKAEDCFLADLSALNVRYESLDGSHPTRVGHQEIAAAWIVCLNRLFNR